MTDKERLLKVVRESQLNVSYRVRRYDVVSFLTGYAPNTPVSTVFEVVRELYNNDEIDV